MGHKPPIPDKVSPEGKDFLCHCLESDPKMRWTASQLLDHPFVKVCLVALATKTVGGNQEQLSVGFIICSCAAGLCVVVGGWYQADAVQKTRFEQLFGSTCDVASKHVTERAWCVPSHKLSLLL